MNLRYCSVCKKKTRSIYKLNENGVETFKCENGHYSPVTDEKPKDGPMFIVKCDGFHGKSEGY